MSWLAASLVLSIVLTIVLNLAIRLFPGAGQRLGDSLERLAAPPPGQAADERRVRVMFPWRLMLLVSIVGTIVLNLLIWMR